MELIPIRTRIMQPPQDDLWSVLDESLTEIDEGDVVLISSKVVAIHEGRCFEKTKVDKKELARQEAEITIPRTYWGSPITISHHALVGAAGIDESNGNGYLVLLPKDPFASAQKIHSYLVDKFLLKNVGVVVTDSESVLFRYGAIGVAIGWWGLSPLQDHRGRLDIFGRPIKAERSNIVDGLAAAAGVVCGEVNEQTPIVVARKVPNLDFKNSNTRDDIFAPFGDDKFRVLYEKFLT